MPSQLLRTFIHRIDGDDLIDFVNDDWLAFAAENDAAELICPGVLGKSIWQFVSGAETRQLYENLLDKVRSQKVDVRVPYRCDSPGLRRFMQMTIVPVGPWVEFQSQITRMEEREEVELLDRKIERSEELIVACAWCKRVATPEWMDVEVAVNRLHLFEQERMP